VSVQGLTAGVWERVGFEGMTEPDVICDVLIVGAGAGGMAAAAVAADRGLDVIVVEKAPVFGGSTALSAGVIWVPDNRFMRAAGMADSTETAMTYLEHEVGNRLNRDVAETFLNTAPEMHAWFEDNTRVAFDMQRTFADYHADVPGAALGGRALVPQVFEGSQLGGRFRDLRPPLPTMMVFGGMMIARQDFRHMFRIGRSVGSTFYAARLIARYGWDRLRHPRGTRLSNGNALAAMLALSLFDRDVPVWLSAPVVELMHEEGRVSGATVDRDGTLVTVTARRGVVLAAGGFPADDALKQRVFPHVAAGHVHRSLPPETCSGDCMRLGRGRRPSRCLDAGFPGAPASGAAPPLPAFYRPGQTGRDRRRQARPALYQRGQLLPRLRAAND
jgi:glycine/D-amino acid oxidase-like deaminating enzyme